MARARKTGDTYYNARRRYQRAAERNMKKAEQATGATAARYRALAKQDLQKALDTYDKGTTQNFSKPISNLAEKLGVNLAQKRKQLKSMTDKAAKQLRESAEEKSSSRLEKNIEDIEVRRQAEAKAIFSSGIGSRIIGGLVDVWRDKAIENGKVDKKKMMQVILDYFKVDNLADLLQAVEKQIGERLYHDGDSETLYETVKLVIQSKVADNTLVA